MSAHTPDPKAHGPSAEIPTYKAREVLSSVRSASSDERPRGAAKHRLRDHRRRPASVLLTVAGLATIGVALFQAVISFSPDVSRALGAPAELTSRPAVLLLAGCCVAAAFAALGIYGLAAAGLLHCRLPFQRFVVWFAGLAFTTRGMLPALAALGNDSTTGQVLPKTAAATSMLSLAIGLLTLGSLAPTLFFKSEPTGRAQERGR